MAPRVKFNPRTGRYESVTPTPSPTTTLPERRYAPNDTREDNRPKAPTARATTTTTVAPKKKTTVGGNQNKQVTSGARVSSLNKPNINEYNVPSDLSDEDLGIDGLPAWLQQYLTGNSGTGGGGPSNADSYRAGMDAAGIQRRAGATGQQQYGSLADTSYGSAMKNIADLYNPQTLATGEFYDKQKAAAEAYYAGQGTQATGTIDAATLDLLNNLKGTSAYTDVQGTNVAAPTQGLSDVLKAYGGTGEAASQQQAMDAAQGKAIADLFTRSNKQLAAADADYYTGLQNAARGAQTASKQQLAQAIATLQGQDVGNINAARRTDLSNLASQRTSAEQQAQDLRTQLLGKGIESLMSGQQAAAATEAQTTASYGKPKPKAKPKAKPKKK